MNSETEAVEPEVLLCCSQAAGRCWTSQPDCLSDLCLVSAPPAHIHKGTYRFCCCSRDLCNRHFREAPVTEAPPPVRRYSGKPLPLCNRHFREAPVTEAPPPVRRYSGKPLPLCNRHFREAPVTEAPPPVRRYSGKPLPLCNRHFREAPVTEAPPPVRRYSGKPLPLCNRHFREAPVTEAPPPVRRYSDGSASGQRSALVAVGTVAGALTLVSLLFCGYRLLTGKKKLSLVSVRVPETSNASCVDLEELSLWELIGGGRYSTVYLGSLSERSVAVKVFSPAHRHKYVNERYIYSLLSLRQQPHIAHFLCADERVDSEGCTQFLIVMDYYPHGCLSHFLSRSSVDWTSCCRMMLGVTRGLSFLHSEVLPGDESKPALAHRDVSSSNVLVRSDLSCVLADFSLSMSLSREPSRLHGDGDCVAISEVGSLRYRAPELLAGALDLHEYGTALKQVDVYALGLLFWESFRRCHHLFPGRAAPHFQQAFALELGQEPTLELMHMLVVRDKCRPGFPVEWKDNSPVLRLLKDTIEDCWDQDAEARLSAQCAEERLHQLSLLRVSSHRKHSNGYCPPSDPSCFSPDTVVVDLTGSRGTEDVTGSRGTENHRAVDVTGSCSRVDHRAVDVTGSCSRVDHRAVDVTGSCSRVDHRAVDVTGSCSRVDHRAVDVTGSCSRVDHRAVDVTGSCSRVDHRAVDVTGSCSRVDHRAVDVDLPQLQVQPQRPSSLQLPSSAASRPRGRLVQTGVAKMDSVAVLARAPVSVTMATGRRAVRMADGSSAGVPTLVTNRLMARGVTNWAGPQEEEPCSRSSAQQSTTDQEPGLSFLWSPDEQLPLLQSEVPPAGALLSLQSKVPPAGALLSLQSKVPPAGAVLSVPRSNVNNNNSNNVIHSQTAQQMPSEGLYQGHKTRPSEGLYQGQTTRPSEGLYQGHKTRPSEGLYQEQKTRPTEETRPSEGLYQGQKTRPTEGLYQGQKTCPTEETRPSEGLYQGHKTCPTEESHPGQKTRPSEESHPGHKTRPSEESHPGQKTRPSEESHPGQKTRSSEESHPGQKTRPSEESHPGQKTRSSEESHPGQKTRPPEETHQGHKTGPSEETHPGHKTRPSEETHPGHKTGPSVGTLSEQKTSLSEKAQALDKTFLDPADRTRTSDLNSEDISHSAGVSNNDVTSGPPQAFSCSASSAAVSHMSPECPGSAADQQDTNRDMSSDSAQSPNRRPSRPTSLSLSSSSEATGGAPQTDSGLSVSGEKIRRRVKTPYTVKKWRPASWAPPADQSELFLQATPNRSSISQSKSSMAMFLQGGGATSKPDGFTSF
ncbi:hypothetical protein WMY93_002083 [Mugilogobius chulae]|uniref:receptor protein serine/threonine kinase n=1 Tax=Mugilogobius chulae TaxID=88201 RepID=A0AAW0Q3I2_9GOBI